eukprot:TRINITY_DN90_c2_g2_i1.p2 TRINITY_DN90_c2_g2~~TRINITY_DN90_c2_g2_i1.p2  ORF type:complete len:226 (-),score=59.30 TRINITY_DN90_c2_g2_i1:53-730(-)
MRAVTLLFLVFASSFLVKAAEQQETCSVCVSFMDNAINQLLQIIANGGVLGSCSALCGALPNQYESLVCNLLCDYVGIEAFIDLVNDVDPDPIWICEEISVCPINDYVKGQLLSLTVTPTAGAQGTTFTITGSFKLLNTTGTGEVVFQVVPPDSGDPIEGGGLLISQPAGTYNERASIQTQPSENEPFSVGTYQVIFAVCEGSCGSTHSHSYTICQGQTTFEIKA